MEKVRWQTVPTAVCDILTNHCTRAKLELFRRTGATKLFFTPEARTREKLVDVHKSTLPGAGQGLFATATHAFALGDLISMVPLRWSNDASVLPMPRVRWQHDPATGKVDCVTIDWEGTLHDVAQYESTSLAGRNVQTTLHITSTASAERKIAACKPIAAGQELFRSYGAAQWRQMQMTPMVHATKMTDIAPYQHIAFSSPAADRAAYNSLMLWMWLLLYHHMMACEHDDDQWMLLYGSFLADFHLPASSSPSF